LYASQNVVSGDQIEEDEMGRGMGNAREGLKVQT